MDPYDPTTFNHKFAIVNGIRMHYIDENSASTNVLLMVHGWPDLWLGWRHQIGYFARLGYRVVVPTLRGYGETDAPEDIATYGDKTVSADLAILLDYLHIPTVVVVGHDWGGVVAWRFTQFYPNRVRAVASFCTPYSAPEKEYIPLEKLVEILPTFAYQLYLVSSAAEKEINDHTEDFFKRCHRTAAESKALIDKRLKTLVVGRPKMERSKGMSQKVLEYYVQTYQQSGARGSLNWYKRRRISFEECKDLDPIIRKPALMVTASRDVVLLPELTKNMSRFIPNLEEHGIEGAGHWVLWENPDACNRILHQWLTKVSPTAGAGISKL